MAADTQSSFAVLDGQSSPPISGAAGNAHTRTYQACIPCRKRKVRCNLGPVDNPHDPPCDRCRRESKECFFSATRRKKRPADSGADEIEPDDFEVKGGRKRLKGEDDEPAQRGFSAFPLTPGGMARTPAPIHRPSFTTSNSHTSHPSARDEQDDEQVSLQTAAILQNAEVHSGHDALNVLLEAATHHRAGSASTGSRPTDVLQGRSPHEIPNVSPVLGRRMTNNGMPPPLSAISPGIPQIDPAITYGSVANASAAELTSALKAWSRFKFVRAGWFSAREAIQYVDYFYTKLSPLTPIVMPDFTSLASHATMLEEEPMLAVTILTIASRHMKLGGAGSQSRPSAIHQKLWSYLEGMINRLVWGQEQFGSNVYVTGQQQGCDIVPYGRKGLRTLGSVESLMLLTEWHPRSMHFPPEDDDSELMMPEIQPTFNDSEDNGDAIKGIGGQRMDTWLEPCWRSDRICWMLLSMAMSLAFEIGVFDENAARHLSKSTTIPDDKRIAYEHRRLHVKDLLMVYMTQTSGRVGLTSMLPKNYCEPALSHIYDLHNAKNTKDLVIHLWLKIASIMKTGNEELFANRDTTRDIIRTGRYKDLLRGLYPQLTSWRHTMDNNARDIPALMRHVLEIDYEYCRVYLNSLGLQAVVERCTRNTPKQEVNATKAAQGMAQALASGASIPASVLEKCYGSDRFYVNEVTDGCRRLLKSVVEGLYPGEHLRHAPVRTYFRIISVAIILLKTFALGATEDDVAISLGYLDRTIEALQTCIVDDVHVASRFADLLRTLTDRIRARFVRMTRMGPNGFSRGTSKSPADVHGIPTSQPVSASALRTSLNHSTPWSGHPAVQGFANGNGREGSHPNGNNNNPLYGISTQAFDFEDNGGAFNVMPPPTNPPSPSFTQTSLNGYPNGYSTGQQNGQDGFVDENGNLQDWLALPLDPILNSYGADVTQTGFGPGVGEYDMLELLLNGGGQQGQS
ncbi:Fungal Zn(2)-Cys(6) binuclear cluster domain-containing protein 12 [Elsinoe fawcettii]|nr:Fungal Zn(2)-Cys(6) binuclear cluster domain-containing protein 12 [Elsinoe fawcettii]